MRLQTLTITEEIKKIFFLIVKKLWKHPVLKKKKFKGGTGALLQQITTEKKPTNNSLISSWLIFCRLEKTYCVMLRVIMLLCI